MATYRSEPPVPTDIITYRMGSTLVYVKPAENYQEALDVAQQEFPELANAPRNHITFIISAKMDGERREVRISESAWGAAVTRLLRGEVIDVHLRSTTPNGSDTKGPPPQYLEVPQPPLRQCASAPHSRSQSREVSPTPSEKVSSRSWFGKH